MATKGGSPTATVPLYLVCMCFSLSTRLNGGCLVCIVLRKALMTKGARARLTATHGQRPSGDLETLAGSDRTDQHRRYGVDRQSVAFILPTRTDFL